MAKFNITQKEDELLPWDSYLAHTPDEAAAAIYTHVRAYARRSAEWYWQGIRRKRHTVVTVRWLSFLLLLAGTLLPLGAAMWQGNGDQVRTQLLLSQLGVAALALGGLLQLGDRLFGWSSGWTRYTATVTAIENRGLQFELEWTGLSLGKQTPLTRADLAEFHLLAKQFEDDILKLKSDETAAWVTEFTSGTALLTDAMRQQRESAAATSDALGALARAAQGTGALELTLPVSAPPAQVTVQIDAGAPVVASGATWAKVGIASGDHVLRVVVDGTPPRVIEKVITIQAGAIRTLTVQ